MTRFTYAEYISLFRTNGTKRNSSPQKSSSCGRAADRDIEPSEWVLQSVCVCVCVYYGSLNRKGSNGSVHMCHITQDMCDRFVSARSSAVILNRVFCYFCFQISLYWPCGETGASCHTHSSQCFSESVDFLTFFFRHIHIEIAIASHFLHGVSCHNGTCY